MMTREQLRCPYCGKIAGPRHIRRKRCKAAEESLKPGLPKGTPNRRYGGRSK